jgi:hypothetical protein
MSSEHDRVASDSEGIERRDPHEVRREVDARRIKRRLKAAASLLLAATAGTFLACIGRREKNRPNPAPNPMTHEVSNLPAPARPAAVPAQPDAATDTTRPGPPDAGRRVDRKEHRKGMPVRDNLLE